MFNFLDRAEVGSRQSDPAGCFRHYSTGNLTVLKKFINFKFECRTTVVKKVYPGN
jgi:hypothetical protein